MGGSHGPVILVRAAEERTLQGAAPDYFGAVLDLESGVLERRRIEKQRCQTIEIAGVEGLAKGVENGGGHRRLFRFRCDQLGTSPVKRGFDRSDGRRERFGDLFER